MKELNPVEVMNKYNAIDEIWKLNDKWHFQTYKWIKSFIQDSKKLFENTNRLKILNAGSGGNGYGFNEENILHVDLAKKKIQHLKNFIVGNIENIPLTSERFNLIICVGSVINYCDPIKVFNQFKRFLEPKGYIILEFENSYTLELLGKEMFNKKAALIETFYNKEKEKLWYFSEHFITELVQNYKLSILKTSRCHLISPLLYRITKKEDLAAQFCILDPIISYLPFLNKFSSNVIMLLKN